MVGGSGSPGRKTEHCFRQERLLVSETASRRQAWLENIVLKSLMGAVISVLKDILLGFWLFKKKDGIMSFLSSVSVWGYEICRKEIYLPYKMIFLVILRKMSQMGKG